MEEAGGRVVDYCVGGEVVDLEQRGAESGEDDGAAVGPDVD